MTLEGRLPLLVFRRAGVIVVGDLLRIVSEQREHDNLLRHSVQFVCLRASDFLQDLLSDSLLKSMKN